jgi:hypothetical protein
MSAIEDLKRQIGIHELAERLGLERPDPHGNYRSPHHKDKFPSVQVGGKKYPDGWFDHSAGVGGDQIDLVEYVQGIGTAEAIQWLRDQYNLPDNRRTTAESRPTTLVEHIAAQSLKETDASADYLAGRGILYDVIDRAIKAKAVGFNAWTSPKKSLGSAGYGGPATVFLVRSFNPGRLVAVDLRYHDPSLNGGVKTGCQGEKVGYPWTTDLRALQRAKTVVVVESPINALSVESAAQVGRLSDWAAIATRGVNNLEDIDLLPYRGKRVLLCFDRDEPDAKGRRPGQEAGWALHARMTAHKIAVHLIDQSEWNCNDINDLLCDVGPEETARALQKFQPWAIPGVPGRAEKGRSRVFLPLADFAVYYQFRVREDFTSYVQIDRDADGNEQINFKDLAGFRVADIARINIASASATLTGDIDRQPNILFAVTAQTPYHGSDLVRIVTSFERIHNLDWWKRIGPVWRPSEFLRLITLWGRAITLNQREAVNFVGLCWKNGKPHVNEGPDAYFTDPEKQCPYHNLAFPSGSSDDARRVIRAYAQTFSHHAALLLLVWALGGHLKAFLSFWPHLTLQARKGSGKSTLTERLSRSIACTMFSGQSLQTDFRLITSISHTSHPVGWEELSARRQEIIDRAVSILQEAYKHTITRRGSEMTEFVACAPVLLAGEDVPVRSLLGKVVRVQLRQKGELLPFDLPAFPVRQWLDYLATLKREQVLGLHAQASEFCHKHCRAEGHDDGAKRMVDNYAGLLVAWRLLRDFCAIDVGEIPLESALLREMNEHIAETSADREPWVWIVEVILNEIAAAAYPLPYRFGLVEDQEVIFLRPAHMIHHLQTKPGLRAIWDGLPVKSDRVFKKQLQEAGVIVADRVHPTISGQRVDHMVALSIAKLAEYGLYPEESTRAQNR